MTVEIDDTPDESSAEWWVECQCGVRFTGEHTRYPLLWAHVEEQVALGEYVHSGVRSGEPRSAAAKQAARLKEMKDAKK